MYELALLTTKPHDAGLKSFCELRFTTISQQRDQLEKEFLLGKIESYLVKVAAETNDL